jgi:hypothetical protein
MKIVGAFDRIAACYGSFAGILLQCTLMTMTLESGWCGSLLCRDGVVLEPPKYVELRWQPYIQTTGGHGQQPTPDFGPHCPARAADAPPVWLSHAPLPARFDPREAEGLYACVRVDSRMHVREAYLLPGGRAGDLAQPLLERIREDWRFVAEPRVSAEPGWQRVRLFEERRPQALVLG